jgi:hypothetical protein
MSKLFDKILGRSDVLKADDLVIELVEVPAWEGSLYVKGMSGTERDAYESSIMEQRGNKREVNLSNFRAKLVAYSACDEKGKLLFSQKDIESLGKKSAAGLQRVYDVATRLSAVSKSDVEELTEELEENPFVDSASS